MKKAEKIVLAVALASTSVLAQSAAAQTAGEAPAPPAAAESQVADGGEIISGEIIVTAQKRSECLGDVPISIAAASAEQLASAGVRTVADLEKIVPGFVFTQSNYGNPVFSIRGIGLYDTAIGVAPTVTVYSDQVPMPFLAMSKGVTLDVERVEVLKGPQGTLFGQNSTGGAVNYIAAKPGGHSAAGFDLTFGRFATVDASGFVSVPLGDTLGARLAVKHEMSDGWQRSVSRPGDKLGARDFTQGRLIVDWNPSSTIDAEFVAEAWHDGSENQAGQFRGYYPSRPGVPDIVAALGSLPLAPENPRAADWDDGVPLSRDEWFYRGSARFGFDLSDEIRLVSISSYERYTADDFADADGTSLAQYYANNVAKVNSFFQELRGEYTGSRLNLTVGLNYQNDKVDEYREFPDFQASSGVFGPFRFRAFKATSNQKSRTYSAFGGGSFEIADGLKVEGGIRYSKQDRDYDGCLFDVDGQLARIAYLAAGGSSSSLAPPVQGQCVSLIQTPTGFVQRPTVTNQLNEDNVSWRAGVNYKPAPRTLIYASVSRGYKAGTFTPLPALFAVQLNPATQETVLSYEAGIKTGTSDGLLTLTGAAFHYDYTDKQILGITRIAGLNISVPQLVNVPKSRVNGAELDVTLRPVPVLTLRGGLAYIDSKVKGSFLTTSLYNSSIDISGQSFPLTPKWQASGGATLDLPVSDGLKASLASNVTYRSATKAVFGPPAETENRLKPYALVGVRAGIGADDDKWRVELWGENIFNTYYWSNVVKSPDALSRFAGMPATYGITLRTRFN